MSAELENLDVLDRQPVQRCSLGSRMSGLWPGLTHENFAEEKVPHNK